MASPIAVGGILTGIELVADALLKQYTLDGRELFYYLGIAGYAALGAAVGSLLQGVPLALANAYWDAFSGIATALLGLLVFGEQLSQTQWLGIGLVSAGVFMIAE